MTRHLLLLTALLVGSSYTFAQTELRFIYDAAGNQTLRMLCTQGGGCTDTKLHLKTLRETTIEEDIAEKNSPENNQNITIYPNPTSGEVHLSWNPSTTENLQDIYLTNSAGTVFIKIPFVVRQSEIDFDLSTYPSGLYIFKFLFSQNHTPIYKKIIKH